MRRGKLILLLGISGAGKTTTGLAVARATPVTYLYAVTEKLELVRPGETLNLLDQARTYEVNGQFFAKVLTQPGALLVDTHATYPVGGAFVNLTPAGACPGIGGMVFLEADPATIRARRLARGRASEATELGMIEREARGGGATEPIGSHPDLPDRYRRGAPRGGRSPDHRIRRERGLAGALTPAGMTRRGPDKDLPRES